MNHLAWVPQMFGPQGVTVRLGGDQRWADWSHLGEHGLVMWLDALVPKYERWYSLGMYLCTIGRYSKDGSVVRYLQLADNQWGPVGRLVLGPRLSAALVARTNPTPMP
jgi:hypothetical protein